MNAPSALVFDPNHATRQLLVGYLIRLGLNARGCTTLAEVAQTTTKCHINLLVVDLVHAKPQDLEAFLPWLSSNSPDTRLIVLTKVAEPRLIGLSNTLIPRNADYINSRSEDSLENLAKAALAATTKGAKPLYRQHLQAQHRLSVLSRSQLHLLIGLAYGLSNQEIANQRGTTIRAVENLLKRTLDALQIVQNKEISSRVMAARLYIQEIGGQLPTNG